MPWTKPVYCHRPFLSAEYLPTAQGVLKPQRPPHCPDAEDGVPGQCKVSPHAFRDRKCGPGFRLAIFLCKNHLLSFTVYPLDWLPYSRRPLLGGDSLSSAAQDLAVGKAWPETSKADLPTRKTQYRWVLAFLKLLGVSPENTEEDRHRASGSLGIATLQLNELANQIRAGPTWKSRAQYIAWLFSTRMVDLISLVTLGFQIGYWGKLYRYTGLIGRPL